MDYRIDGLKEKGYSGNHSAWRGEHTDDAMLKRGLPCSNLAREQSACVDGYWIFALGKRGHVLFPVWERTPQ